MRDRYEGMKGKENVDAAARQKRLESEHTSNDAFAKSVNAMQAKHAGVAPKMPKGMYEFNATMSNTGEHAQEFARKLTAGLDKTAFPVK